MLRKATRAILAMAFLFGCGPVVLIPLEMDLTPFAQVGLISFSLENAAGHIDEIATQRFLREITFPQRGVQIFELGTMAEVLAKIDKSTIDQEAISAIGERFDVKGYFYGKASVSDVKSQID